MYRPAAFLLVKGLARLPITPNQVTILSLAAGLGAAWQFSSGSAAGLMWGAILYALANLFDCADGQLARIQKSGTVMGRVLDGTADYVTGIAVFAGIGWGLERSGDPSWPLVIAAGFSGALHAMVFDYYQSEFLSSSRGESDFTAGELNRFGAEITRLRDAGEGGARVFLLRIYMAYTRMQGRIRSHTKAQALPARSVPVRFWSLLGPSTDRTILIICALTGSLRIYLWLVAGILNAWLAVGVFLQWKIGNERAAA